MPFITSYSGRKPFSTSTDSFFLGRSRTCPRDALTIYLSPRYLLIVLALAGDSTTTKSFPIYKNILFKL